MRYGLMVLAVLTCAVEVRAQSIVEGGCVIEGPLWWRGGLWEGPSGPAFPRSPQIRQPAIYSVPLTQVPAASPAPGVGALVLSVSDHGAARKARIDAGDRIIAINYEPIGSAEDYYRLIEGSERVTLSVQDGRTGRIRRRVVTPDSGRIGIQFVVR